VARPRGWKSYDSVADEYERLTPQLFGPLARELVARLRPPPGGRLLDVGAGTGEEPVEVYSLTRN
jgi:ubiquinone/menaquinone biosynthesis C-methylase UbiE